MIIYGSRATEITNENIIIECSQCGSENSTRMSIFQIYFHIYWIPIYPKGKTGVTQCMHCNHVIEKEEFNENYTKAYTDLKRKTKTPIWTFIGSVILTALIVYFSVKNNM